MEISEAVIKLREMLSLAEQIKAGGVQVGLAGDIDRIIAILKEKIRLFDPLNFDSVDYFKLEGERDGGQ
jgi:hypothetical protein